MVRMYFSFNYSTSNFSALLSVVLFINFNSKIVASFFFFFLFDQERYGLLGNVIAAIINEKGIV